MTDERAGAQFEAAMQTRSHAVEAFPGFVRFEFRRELGRNARFVIATWWETSDDLRRYLASPEHRSTHSRLPDWARAGLGKPTIVVQDVREVAT